MSIIIKANRTTGVLKDTKYMKPKETQISIGMGNSASKSIRPLRNASARIRKGNQIVLISCTGISSINVSFMAWSKNTMPVAAASRPSSPEYALFSLISFLISSQKSSALPFMLGGTRQIQDIMIDFLSPAMKGLSPSWWWPACPKYVWICTTVSGFSTSNRLTMSCNFSTKPFAMTVAAVGQLRQGCLHLMTIISLRRIARPLKCSSNICIAALLRVPGGGVFVIGAALRISPQANGAKRTVATTQTSTKTNRNL
mmetsp:Transcript_29187/g.88329  ORF Transcript_29187/g.88329 Transcript_29187/m.88329 type:complete len:256 (+) Transcript_29187:79-846(+)